MSDRILRLYLIVWLVSVFLPVYVQAADNRNLDKGSLSERYNEKILHMAEFVSSELAAKKIRTVTVRPFSGPDGITTREGKLVTDRFVKSLSSMNKGTFVIQSGAQAEVVGTLASFAKGDKKQLSIKVVNNGTGRIITSYSAILK